MLTKKRTLVIALSVILGSAQLLAAPFAKAIYGHDDRYDVDQYYDQSFAQLAKATAAQIPAKALHKSGNNYSFDLTSIESSMDLCPEERFLQQSNIARCSGFLLAPDILVTAGHCIASQTDCDDNRWVFGYRNNSTNFSTKNVYKCKQVIKQKLKNSMVYTKDFAIIRLDRPVAGVTPLKYRTKGRVKKGTPVAVIGNPSGLPTKITDGNVAKWNILEKITFPFAFIKRANYFTARVDTFGGNSGSAVINRNTHKVEGILVSGAPDYEIDQERHCRYSARYADDDNIVFEKVIKIRVLKRLLKKVIK